MSIVFFIKYRSKRMVSREKEFGLDVGDVIVMRGDPKHSSEPIDGNRLVALYFYHRKGKSPAPPGAALWRIDQRERCKAICPGHH